jgi:hypothetical protein
MRNTLKKIPELKNTIEVLLTPFLAGTCGRLKSKNGKLNA